MLRFEASRVMWDPIEAKNGEREKTKCIGNDIKRERVCVKRTKRGLRSERGKVGREGFVAAGLVQIDDGSVEEERRDGEVVRRETWRKENEM